MPPRHFKSDESFLEKLAMGATGARRTASDLQARGHVPLELERGCMNFKIWKAIKVKRVRVADLLCLRCGERIESRAKSTLELSMSHSHAVPERGWNHGLSDDDVVAFVRCERTGPRPVDWEASDLVQYVRVSALRAALDDGRTRATLPKGAQEGFEVRLAWPAAFATSAGVVESVLEDRSLRYRRPDGRLLNARLVRRGQVLKPLVKAGESVREGQVVAAVVAVSTDYPCVHACDVSAYLERCKNVALGERYAAVKALGHLDHKQAVDALLARVRDDHEHVYLRVEAAAGLLRLGHGAGIEFLGRALSDSYLANRLEAVIALGDLSHPKATHLLSEVVVDTAQHPEVRAGAAWSLGEGRTPEAVPVLVRCFSDLSLPVRVEAARALAKAARSHAGPVAELFASASAEQRPGVAWALSRAGHANLEDLLPALCIPEARPWIAYIVGTQPESGFVPAIEQLAERDAEVYFAVTVLWKILASWIHGLDEY